MGRSPSRVVGEGVHKPNLFKDPPRLGGMVFHDLEFVGCQAGGFGQNRLGGSDFSDIVKQSRDSEPLDVVIGQAEDGRDALGIVGSRAIIKFTFLISVVA
jgi:hypothetical protein